MFEFAPHSRCFIDLNFVSIKVQTLNEMVDFINTLRPYLYNKEFHITLSDVFLAPTHSLDEDIRDKYRYMLIKKDGVELYAILGFVNELGNEGGK